MWYNINKRKGVILLKWYEFEYNKPYNSMQKRLRQEYNSEKLYNRNFDDINIYKNDRSYEPYDWEEDVWNLKMGLE